MLDAAQAHGRGLARVMENYLFYQPLRRPFKAVAESGEIGPVGSYHMKMTGTGQGGWEVPVSSFLPQLEQMQRGRGILVFDDGWHKLSTALWLFGPRCGRSARGSGTPRSGPASTSTRLLTIVWGARQRRPRGVGHHPGDGHVPALGLLHQRRALGGHRHDGGTRGSTAAPGAASSSRASRSTPTGRCARTTPSTTTGPAASAIPDATGCAGCTPARGPCCGVAPRRSTSSASPWPPTRAARPAGLACTPVSSDNSRDNYE